MRHSLWCVILSMFLTACAHEQRAAPEPAPAADRAAHRSLESDQPSIWGGDVRCDASSCLLAAVLHDKGAVAVWRFSGRTAVRVAEASTAYHPDHARWLADGRLAVAVETSASIDVFRLQGDSLVREQQVPVGFPPRAVIAADFDGDGREDLIAAPYSGKTLSWMPGRADGTFAAGTPVPSCATPWHVKLLPGAERPGLIAGCLDDKTLTVWDNLGSGRMVPRTVLRFDPVPRDVAVSPDGRTAWVALELGGHGARVDLLPHAAGRDAGTGSFLGLRGGGFDVRRYPRLGRGSPGDPAAHGGGRYGGDAHASRLGLCHAAAGGRPRP